LVSEFRRMDELLVSQANHRIDARPATRGDVTGSERDTEQNDGNGGKGQRIRRRNSIKQSSHQARE
jgi:hypothetical protein